MTIEHRITALEKQTGPAEPPMTFRLCDAHGGLTTEEHEAHHHERGELCFSLNLGDCEVSCD